MYLSTPGWRPVVSPVNSSPGRMWWDMQSLPKPVTPYMAEKVWLSKSAAPHLSLCVVWHFSDYGITGFREDPGSRDPVRGYWFAGMRVWS
jgi:hypothetical protein